MAQFVDAMMTSSNRNIFRVTGHLWGIHRGTGNSLVPGEFPAQRPVTRSFDVFCDVRLNKLLSKQWWGWWFETSSCPLWRHRNAGKIFIWWSTWVKDMESKHEDKFWSNPFRLPSSLLYKRQQIPKTLMYLASSCSSLCPIHWSQVLSREWRCSWSSVDRRCFNYIWVINNCIAY